MPANGIMAERTETAAVRLRHSDIVPVSPTVSVQATAEIPDGNHTFPCAGGSRKMPAPVFLRPIQRKAPGGKTKRRTAGSSPDYDSPGSGTRRRKTEPSRQPVRSTDPSAARNRKKTVRKTLSDTTIAMAPSMGTTLPPFGNRAAHTSRNRHSGTPARQKLFLDLLHFDQAGIDAVTRH